MTKIRIIKSSLISICCFISAVIIVSIILAVRVTLLRKKRKKKIAKYLGPAIYDIATGVAVPIKPQKLPGQ